MRQWSRLFAFVTVFSVTMLTTSVLPAQDKTDTTSTTKKKKKKAADSSATPAAASPAAAPAPAATPAAAAKSSKGAPANSAGVSDGDIVKAQSGGMVWVNTESKVYHKSGRYYGKTKQGKFMSEADAKKANYRAAKEEVGTKKN